MSSAFNLTGRDLTTQGSIEASSSLSAAYLNTAADRLTAIENWDKNSVIVDVPTAEANAFSFAVQRWIVNYNGQDSRGFAFDALLSISATFLEDIGLFEPVSANPYEGLAKAMSIGTNPWYEAVNDTPIPANVSNGNLVKLAGIGGMSLERTPFWVPLLPISPVFTFSVRLIGATGSQCVSVDSYTFFDAGDGISPRVRLTLRFSTPDHRTTALPAGQYEICLLVGQWVP